MMLISKVHTKEQATDNQYNTPKQQHSCWPDFAKSLNLRNPIPSTPTPPPIANWRYTTKKNRHYPYQLPEYQAYI